jgi:hypothetical protein
VFCCVLVVNPIAFIALDPTKGGGGESVGLLYSSTYCDKSPWLCGSHGHRCQLRSIDLCCCHCTTDIGVSALADGYGSCRRSIFLVVVTSQTVVYMCWRQKLFTPDLLILDVDEKCGGRGGEWGLQPVRGSVDYIYCQWVSPFYVPLVTVLALDRSLDCVAAIDGRSVQCSQQLDTSTAQYGISSP